MAKETTDVRLARIEEHIKGLRDEVRPILDKVEDHGHAITAMKRDRWWIGTIMTALGSLVGFKIGKAG